jgi:two-component system nitrate/nitrite response regulator NarL
VSPENRDPVRILVADDHTLLREAVCDLLRLEPDFRVVGEAADGADAVALASRLRPDVVLLDVDMPGGHPKATVRRFQQVSPGTHIIMLSAYAEPELVADLLAMGIHGYLHKSVTSKALATTIRGVRRADRQIVSISWTGPRPGGAAPADPLSEREREVLLLVAGAMSNRQIATRLEISEGTVKRHLRNVFDKLGAVSRIDAVNKAVQAALIPPSRDGTHRRAGAPW